MTETSRDVGLNLPDINRRENADRRAVQARRNGSHRNRTIHREYQSLFDIYRHQRRAILRHPIRTRHPFRPALLFAQPLQSGVPFPDATLAFLCLRTARSEHPKCADGRYTNQAKSRASHRYAPCPNPAPTQPIPPLAQPDRANCFCSCSQTIAVLHGKSAGFWCASSAGNCG